MFLSVLPPILDQTFAMHRYKRLREIAAFPSAAALTALKIQTVFSPQPSSNIPLRVGQGGSQKLEARNQPCQTLSVKPSAYQGMMIGPRHEPFGARWQ